MENWKFPFGLKKLYNRVLIKKTEHKAFNVFMAK